MYNNSLLPSTLPFYSESKILSYLENHPKTSKKAYSCFRETKILAAVANVFANKNISPYDVDTQVMKTVHNLNLNYPVMDEAAINVALMYALKDCALGKVYEQAE